MMTEHVVSGSQDTNTRVNQDKSSPLTPHEKIGLAADVAVFMQEKARELGKNLSGKSVSDVLVLTEMLGGELAD
ncbi:hypothetical protein [Hafnia alvei]|uniref:Uncharacterized protein n=1 Tax=Hafnia alvei TaxID=569 RepID=A0ABD7Q818_HAFAL|nr:hypothetical protein [Hafnia alvei]TBL68156.1 hypothetical protein EYY96_09080 [Hafnia alvei]